MLIHQKTAFSVLSFIGLSFTLSCTKPTNAVPDALAGAAPNILFVIADDMGWDAFGRYPGINSTKADTPTLDSLARLVEGVYLER